MTKRKHKDLTDKIISWEGGTMSAKEEVKFFQELVDSGLAWQLQGMYGRRAMDLIRAGLVKPKKKLKEVL